MSVSQDHTLTLSANVPVQIATLGGSTFFAVIVATNVVQIKFQNESDWQQFSQGDVLNGQDFGTVWIKSTTAQTVTFKTGVGQFALQAPVTISNVNASWAGANGNNPQAEVSVTAGSTVLLIGANTNRKSVRVNVKSDQADGVYLGDSGVGATTKGGWLEVGQTDYIETEAALYAYNPSASAITVNLLELERV